MTTTHLGRKTRHKIPFKHKTFDQIRWLGFSACDDADAVFYLDNMTLEIDP